MGTNQMLLPRILGIDRNSHIPEQGFRPCDGNRQMPRITFEGILDKIKTTWRFSAFNLQFRNGRFQMGIPGYQPLIFIDLTFPV